MHFGSEDWIVWSVPTEELLLMLAITDRCQNTQCIAACWPLSNATISMWTSELNHWAMEEGVLVWCITFLHPATLQKLTGTVRGTWQRVQGVALASKFHTTQSNWASVGCVGKQVKSIKIPPHNLQGLRDLLLTSWYQIPEDTFRDLLESRHWWVKAVLAARGRPTQY